ncbi:Arsenical resistance operon repressor [Chitinispirillum alkaliphilum]|nr:Arsenical resistance operon repressor [Chitinispirillum alkaliphilum]
MTQYIDLETFTDLAKALSDPQRIRALLALRKGELCACQIIELLKLAPSTVSKHMSILKGVRIVQSRKEGRWIYYRIADQKRCNAKIWDFIQLTQCSLQQDEMIQKDSEQLDKILSIDLDTLCKRQKFDSV